MKMEAKAFRKRNRYKPNKKQHHSIFKIPSTMKSSFTTKTTTILFLFCLLQIRIYAQNEKGVVIGPDNQLEQSAILELDSDNKGFLTPRMTTGQRDDIPGPVNGLMIYNVTNGVFNRYSNGWKELDDDWTRQGATDHIFKSAGNASLLDGSFGIGTTASSFYKLRIKNEEFGVTVPLLVEDEDEEPIFIVNGYNNVGVGISYTAIDFAIKNRIGNINSFIVKDSDDNTDFLVGANGNVLITDGKLGINTTNPGGQLHIKNTSPGGTIAPLYVQSASDDAAFIVNGWDNVGIGNTGGTDNISLLIQRKVGNLYSLVLSNSVGTAQVRFKHDGTTSFGNVEPDSGYKITATGDPTGNTTGAALFTSSDPIWPAVNIHNSGGGDAPALQVGTGKCYKPGNNMWDGPSDRRLKKDIIDYSEGLNIIKQVRPVWYTYNGEGGTPEGERYVGIIAQEVQKLAPHMVSPYTPPGFDQEYLSFNASAFTYMLINAVQEQQQQIESQNSEINTLKTQYDNLLKRLEILENK